jgi:hypothetical protein
MLGHAVTLPAPLGPQVALFAAMGGLSAALANRGVSIFHDGLRPVIPSLRSGEQPRRVVSRTSFSLGFGFLWAFGLPFSLGKVIPLMFLIFIATDWIGVSLPGDYDRPLFRSANSVRGVTAALVLGALWAVGIAVGLHYAAIGMQKLPIEMADRVQLISAPTLGAFFLFAVLTAAYHYGIRQGLYALLAATAGWCAAASLKLPTPPSWAFGVGLAYLIVLMVREIRHVGEYTSDVPAEWLTDDDDSFTADVAAERDAFKANVARIKRAIPLIFLLRAVTGAAFNWGMLAADPISGSLYAHGKTVAAALVVLGWAIAFIPMKYTTAVVSGCMATGTYLEPVIAMLMPNPLVAGIVTGVLGVAEVFALLWVVQRLERYPSIREIADVMRTAIFHVMEIGFLVGGAIAAVALGGEWGAAAVVAAWFLNSRGNSPVMPMSVGAVTALCVGLVVNILRLVGLSL